MLENVILVDEFDNKLGLMEKMEAHEKGLLHRAISIFVLNSKGQLLLQQRALSKYHSGGLWTNTCCSHPRDEETVEQAAHRRLMEEMGFECELIKILDFIYKAELDKGLTEHEFDHVFLGFCNAIPVLNLEEAADYKWVDLDILSKDIIENPHQYTEWFKIIYDRFYHHIKQQK
jgi:isopentenyl-diphosphate delta-isomerase